MVMDGDAMIDKRIAEVLGPEVDFAYWKKKFKGWFYSTVDHKITSRKVGGPHILNGIDTLDTWSICDFL